MLSGYRALSASFRQIIPGAGDRLRDRDRTDGARLVAAAARSAEVETPYFVRPRAARPRSCKPTATASRILATIVRLLKEERPLAFFSVVAAALALVSVILGAPIFVTFAKTGAVPRFPTAIAATGIMILAFLSLASAFILDSVRHGRLETRRLFYLLTPPVSAERP